MSWTTPKPEYNAEKPLYICVLSNTKTSQIPGLSAAGKTAELTVYTPAGDSELMHTGNIISVPVMPMTPPYDTPTPAVITKSALNLTKVPYVFVNSGLMILPDDSIPMYCTDAQAGEDITIGNAVHDPKAIFENAKKIGLELAPTTDHPVIGESTPGGTTTAMGVLIALGYDAKVSSSADINPVELKCQVVSNSMKRNNIVIGSLRDDPLRAVELLGDPMMPAVAGLIAGFKEYDSEMNIIMAGGTQMAAVYAVAKHMGVNLKNVDLATTRYVMEDKTANFSDLSKALGFKAYISDPGFSKSRLPGIQRYDTGTIKEGAGAGGAMYLANMLGFSDTEFREEVEKVCEILKAGNV
ncbi:MAG: TIGR00303 family protein [Methanosarcinales archaeon]|nr:TIGR00303 family protein [Methanosarcinales archaeon]